MFRKTVLTLTLLLAATLFTACEKGPRISPLADDAVVLAFGDSLTYGTGAPKGNSYPEVLAGLLGRNVINAGIPGEVSASGRERLGKALSRHKPALVILCHGGNDFLRRMDVNRTSDNLEQMILEIRSSGADVVLVGVPKLGFGLEVPDLYARLADKYEIPLEEEILVELLSDSAMKSDAIHPNETGYRLMAEALSELISKAQNK